MNKENFKFQGIKSSQKMQYEVPTNVITGNCFVLFRWSKNVTGVTKGTHILTKWDIIGKNCNVDTEIHQKLSVMERRHCVLAVNWL